MTDEPVPGAGAESNLSRDRARIEPAAPAKKTDLLPTLYVLGFVVLAGALYFLWRNPPESPLAVEDSARVTSLQSQVASLKDAVARLEAAKPAVSPSDVQQLQAQVTALGNKPPAGLDELRTQVAALAARPAAAPAQVQQLADRVDALGKQTVDLKPLTDRIDALEQRRPFDPASLDGKFAAVTSQLNDKVQQLQTRDDDAAARQAASVKDLSARVDELDRQQKAAATRAQLAARLQGVAANLAAGQKLGPIPGAPPALARFADEAPPTEAGLRQSFDTAAAEAQRVSQPAETGSFGSRLWARAQQSVTVRQGDHVLVGDPIAGVLARAREQLDAGDLAGAADTVKGLTGPAAAAMKPWSDKVSALLQARAALSTLVAG